MKTIKITLLLFWVAILSGCSDKNIATTPTLEGQWKLINVRGGFVGVNDSFTPGQIKWNIDTANQTVTIVNNNTDPDLQDILESGTYNYTLTPDANAICTTTFNINNMDLGCYTLTDNELTITYEYADGFTLFLVR